MKPILFNTEMVMAILDGRKTTTRRVIKPQPNYELRRMNDKYHRGQWHEYSENPLCDTAFKSPWGVEYPELLGDVGDILYVRETFCKYDAGHVINGVKYAYKADATPASEEARRAYGYKWHPSIHMPKEAARIFLKVTDVKVERLQDITNAGALAEECDGCGLSSSSGCESGLSVEPYDFSVEKFETVWDSTVKKSDRDKYGWNANPWVWVIEFKRMENPEGSKKEWIRNVSA
jgi:hypothetical protein